MSNKSSSSGGNDNNGPLLLPPRRKALEDLIRHYEIKYNNGRSCRSSSPHNNNQNPFYIHEGLEFMEHENGNMSVKITQDIEGLGTDLIRLPNEERVAIMNDELKTKQQTKNNNKRRQHETVLKKIRTKFDKVLAKDKKNRHKPNHYLSMDMIYRSSADIVLAVINMHDITAQELHTKVWPSPETLERDCYPTWFMNDGGYNALDDGLLNLDDVSDYNNSHKTGTKSNTDDNGTTTTSDELRAMAMIEHQLAGTHTLSSLKRWSWITQYAFNSVVRPVLMDDLKCYDEYIPSFFRDRYEQRQQSEQPDQQRRRRRRTTRDDNDDDPKNLDYYDEDEQLLLESFLYASALIRSRSHTGRVQDTSEIIPIIDLINGYPSYCDNDINCILQRGLITNLPNMELSVICTHKDLVRAGSELFLQYGEISPTTCMVRYAFCPMEVVEHPIASLDTIVLRMPSFLGPQNDPLRQMALRQCDYPTDDKTIERGIITLLNCNDLEKYIASQQRNGYETEDMTSVRQFLHLCNLLDDDAVKYNIQTGRLTGNYSIEQLGQLLLLWLDYNLSTLCSLNETNIEQDLNAAETATTAASDLLVGGGDTTAAPIIIPADVYRLRICQRDSFARWRHAFCKRYNIPSEHSHQKLIYRQFLTMAESSTGKQSFCSKQPMPKAPKCLMDSRGCYVCGRTISLKRCTKCEGATRYCSRQHQIVDWKRGHKKRCDPMYGMDEF